LFPYIHNFGNYNKISPIRVPALDAYVDTVVTNNIQRCPEGQKGCTNTPHIIGNEKQESEMRKARKQEN